MWPEAHLSHTTWLKERGFLHGLNSGRLVADVPLKMSKGSGGGGGFVSSQDREGSISDFPHEEANTDTANDAANDISVEKKQIPDKVITI